MLQVLAKCGVGGMGSLSVTSPNYYNISCLGLFIQFWNDVFIHGDRSNEQCPTLSAKIQVDGAEVTNSNELDIGRIQLKTLNTKACLELNALNPNGANLRYMVNTVIAGHEARHSRRM